MYRGQPKATRTDTLFPSTIALPRGGGAPSREGKRRHHARMGEQAARRSGGRRCMSRRIAVLKGGLSAEREVSLDSGYACAQALREKGYTVSEIDVSRDLGALVKALTPKPDAVFNALHGRWGEDGRSEEHTSELQSLMRLSYAV